MSLSQLATSTTFSLFVDIVSNFDEHFVRLVPILLTWTHWSYWVTYLMRYIKDWPYYNIYIMIHRSESRLSKITSSSILVHKSCRNTRCIMEVLLSKGAWRKRILSQITYLATFKVAHLIDWLQQFHRAGLLTTWDIIRTGCCNIPSWTGSLSYSEVYRSIYINVIYLLILMSCTSVQGCLLVI